jgi:ribosomal protein S18 acetylase RimI-like enzyme
MSRTIRRAGTADIPVIQELAFAIWHEVYPSIISVEQINFMLGMMYSAESLHEQMMRQHAQFLLLSGDESTIGFASWSIIQPGAARLHKLYVSPACHGTGAGAALLNEVESEARAQRCASIELNVNKYNPARLFYEKKGFSIMREEVIDLGSGYVMDDYVMHKTINSAVRS